jgi:hypothetical protein
MTGFAMFQICTSLKNELGLHGALAAIQCHNVSPHRQDAVLRQSSLVNDPVGALRRHVLAVTTGKSISFCLLCTCLAFPVIRPHLPWLEERGDRGDVGAWDARG